MEIAMIRFFRLASIWKRTRVAELREGNPITLAAARSLFVWL
jgi:hypothetical protein